MDWQEQVESRTIWMNDHRYVSNFPGPIMRCTTLYWVDGCTRLWRQDCGSDDVSVSEEPVIIELIRTVW